MRRRRFASQLAAVAVAAAMGGLVFAAPQEKSSNADRLMGEALHQEEVAANFEAAIATYKKVIADAGASRAIVASALLHLGQCYERLGNAEARKAYDRITREFGDQAQIVAQARTRLAALGPAAAGTGILARQVWTGTDVDLEGQPTPDGRYVAFVDWTGATGNLAVRDLTIGENRALTHETSMLRGFAGGIVVSRDGKLLAYSWEDKDGKTSIRTVGIDGSRPRTLIADSDVYLQSGGWSPDGRLIAATAFSNREPSGYVALISTSDGSITRLKSTDWKYPRVGGFSPDGKYVVYAVPPSPGASDGGVFALAVDGSREVLLAKEAGNASFPAWTPDGSAVVFISDRSGAKDLWSVRIGSNVTPSQPELLRANLGDALGVGFSGDGSYFYGVQNTRRDVYVADIDPATLDISLPVKLTEQFVGSNAGGALSPDGRSVAFFRVKGPTKTLVVRDPAGVERVLPTKFETPNAYQAATAPPVWFPDGKSFLVFDQIGQRRVIRRVNLDTGVDTVLLEDRNLWTKVAISPDGASVYFTKFDRSPKAGINMLRLMKRDVATGTERELYHAETSGVGFFGLAVSPDGRKLSFSMNTDEGRSLLAMLSDGGTPVVLHRGDDEHPDPWSGTWTTDSQHVLVVFEDGPADGRPWSRRLVAIPADGGAPRKLNVRMEVITGASLSADGRKLIFTGALRSQEMWVLKNLIAPARASR
jgi:Tol biopolymer transport system component